MLFWFSAFHKHIFKRLFENAALHFILGYFDIFKRLEYFYNDMNELLFTKTNTVDF